jgi:predicted ATPase/class 3 adenylate cyclase
MLAAMQARDLPTGTITFLFTDMEGSTRLVADLGPSVFADVLERHNRILRAAFAEHGGVERGTQGDSFLVMFREAPSALAAAAAAQRGLAAAIWPKAALVRIRMGLHTGLGTLGGDDYVGLDVNRAARIAAAAHGGQVLVSDATRALTESALPAGLSFRPLGQHSLRDLGRSEEIHQLVVEGLEADFPPIRASGTTSQTLPQRLTSFIGRERDLADLEELVRAHRLVTLTGPGGTGKTSLAIELARSVADRFPGGVWWVPLESVADPRLVEITIAATIGLVEAPNRTAKERITDFLGNGSHLLVLDNFEHLLDAAPLVGELVQAIPKLNVLVTSRAPLHLLAEQEYPVAPLPTPGPIDPVAEALRSPAIRLFVERAKRIRPDYELSTRDAGPVAEVCRRLDGLPLGIELAASRISLLSPAAMATRLAATLDLPGAAPRDVPARQRSVTAAIRWSYDLLEPPERGLLDRLSVFVGGCRLEEAEAVCGPSNELGVAVIDGLSALVDHGLVQVTPGPDGARYQLLETIRLFGGNRLDEGVDAALVRGRYADAYLSMAEAVAPHLPGRGQIPLLDRLESDIDNIRAVIRWAIDIGEAQLALRLATASWRLWQIRGYVQEGHATMTEILAMPGAAAPTIILRRALEAAGGLSWWMGQIPGSEAYYRQELEVATELEEEEGIANAYFNLSYPAFALRHDQAELETYRNEAVSRYAALGDERMVARARWSGLTELASGDRPAEARKRVEELLHEFERLDDELYVGLTSVGLSYLAFALGDIPDALRWGLRALRSAASMGERASTALGLRGMALLFLSAGRYERAATIYGAFESASRRYLAPSRVPDSSFNMGWSIVDAESILHSEQYSAAAALGLAMSWDEGLEYTIGAATELIAQEAAAS